MLDQTFKDIRFNGVCFKDIIPEPDLAKQLSVVPSISSKPKQVRHAVDYIGDSFACLSLPLVLQICKQLHSKKPKDFFEHHFGTRNQQLAEIVNNSYDEFSGNILSAFGCAHVYPFDNAHGFPTVLELLINEYDMKIVEEIKIPGSCPPWFDDRQGCIKRI